MTDLIILATLLPGPAHGYQLKRQAGLLLGQENLHNNLVYPLLRRFVAKRWLTRKPVPGQRGQTRQQYSLTALGRKELLSRLSSLSDQEARAADEFRFRVGMFQMLAPAARQQILNARERFLKTRIHKVDGIQQHFELDRFAGEVTARLRFDSEAELGWIEHLRKISS